MCKYGLLYLVAAAIAVLCVQLHYVDCFNKQKKNRKPPFNETENKERMIQ